MPIENKVPGKDVLPSDLTDKFPLVAKKNANQTNEENLSNEKSSQSKIKTTSEDLDKKLN